LSKGKRLGGAVASLESDGIAMADTAVSYTAVLRRHDLETNAESQLNSRRSLGAYYTPRCVADSLIAWANPTRSGRVLDPSFGGCSFLAAAADHAKTVSGAGGSIWGIDIDPVAFEHAERLLPPEVEEHVIKSDFFALAPQELGGTFDAIVGNPPYVRHHVMSDCQRDLASSAAEAAGVVLSRTSDTWAYFLAHSLAFLSPGGRIAFVLPGAVLYSDYAGAILDEIRRRFSTTKLIRVKERLFGDAREQSVVLAAAGFGGSNGTLQYHQIDRISELGGSLLETGGEVAHDQDRRWWLTNTMTGAGAEAWAAATDSPLTVLLGEVFSIRIGAVTGANAFFVRTLEDAEELRSEGCTPIRVVARSRDFVGPVFTPEDLEFAEASGRRTRLLLIDKDAQRHSRALVEEIRLAEAEGLHERSHCRRRDPWFSLAMPARPDAFLPVMGASPSPLYLNSAGMSSTNGVHGLTWLSDSLKLTDAVLGTWTSLHLLAAELAGRHYGGGVLKLEPSDARRLPLAVTPNEEGALLDVDAVFREHGREAAMDRADSIVLQAGLGISKKHCTVMREQAEGLMQYRQDRRRRR